MDIEKKLRDFKPNIKDSTIKNYMVEKDTTHKYHKLIYFKDHFLKQHKGCLHNNSELK